MDKFEELLSMNSLTAGAWTELPPDHRLDWDPPRYVYRWKRNAAAVPHQVVYVTVTTAGRVGVIAEGKTTTGTLRLPDS